MPKEHRVSVDKKNVYLLVPNVTAFACTATVTSNQQQSLSQSQPCRDVWVIIIFFPSLPKAIQLNGNFRDSGEPFVDIITQLKLVTFFPILLI